MMHLVAYGLEPRGWVEVMRLVVPETARASDHGVMLSNLVHDKGYSAASIACERDESQRLSVVRAL